MYTTIEEFITEWTVEMRLTEEVMVLLTDESLSQRIINERRTLGQIAWHLVQSIYYMSHLGLSIEEPLGGNQIPQSAAVVAEEYRRMGALLLQALKTQWTDEKLQETQMIMDEEWSNGASMRFILMHQAHHRGQMTVLMRQAGLAIPEVYGPTYESWINKGLAPLV